MRILLKVIIIVFEDSSELRYIIWAFYDPLDLYIIFESLVFLLDWHMSFLPMIEMSIVSGETGYTMHACVYLEPCLVCKVSNLNK